MIISTASLSQNTFPKIQHGDEIVQLGSCFSSSMSFWFRRAGFRVLDNPLGVIFHPVPLAKQILMAFGKTEWSGFVQKDDVCVSYDANSALYSMSSSGLEKLVKQQLEELRISLEKAKIDGPFSAGARHSNSVPATARFANVFLTTRRYTPLFRAALRSEVRSVTVTPR